MKSLADELRMYAAEVLLGWCVQLLPSDHPDAAEMAAAIISYFQRRAKQ